MFKNRFVAFIIACVVVGSTAANVHNKLGERCADVESSFYVSDAGKSIYNSIGIRMEAANGLWTIVTNYDQDAADKLSGARGTLLEAYNARYIDYMYDANSELNEAFTQAEAALMGHELTSTEADALNDYKLAFEGEQKLISQNGYNETVSTFYRNTLNKFPAGLFANMLGIDTPDLFS